MFYSSRISFDTMFVVLSVIAGASSHSISNSSKKLSNLTKPTRYRASLIDLILDPDVTNNLQPSNFINEGLTTLINDVSTEHTVPVSTKESDNLESRDVCVMFSSILNTNQIRFCQRHRDILEHILPKLIKLTGDECARLTKNLRWNCPSLEPYLDRSKTLSMTREAALIRSLLNASMMYLSLKYCNEHAHRSCGCQSNQVYKETSTFIPEANQESQFAALLNQSDFANLSMDNLSLSPIDLRKLHNGGSLRLSRSGARRQGCLANIPFASTFTKMFLDLDDTKSLGKAHRALNDDEPSSNRKHLNGRLLDPDYKDLLTIKWTKSAVNLHNNHVGRQIVREFTKRQCRCHGLSGICQYRSCWDQLPAFSLISNHLFSIYLHNTTLVEVENFNMFGKPDLGLRKVVLQGRHRSDRAFLVRPENSHQSIDSTNSKDGYPSEPPTMQPNELIFLYDSPDYCERLPSISHPGTKERRCSPGNNLTKSRTDTSKKNDTSDRSTVDELPQTIEGNQQGFYGTCEFLCCNRGYRNELVLDMVTCNCRFKFCCRVECDYCLRQHMLYFCL